MWHQGWQRRRPQPKADCWIGAKAPQGKGRGVGPSPDASKGKGQKFAKDWKGGKEAPAGKGRGVGPNPYASKGKDSKGGTEAHGKGKKGGKAGGKGYRTKRSDMTPEEKQALNYIYEEEFEGEGTWRMTGSAHRLEESRDERRLRTERQILPRGLSGGW